MNLIAKKEVRYSLAILSLGAFIYGVFKLYSYLNNKQRKSPKDNQETRSDGKQSISSEDDTLQQIPYDQIIEDLNNFTLENGELFYLKNIKDLQYRIILCLMKGNTYQGIVHISFVLQTFGDNQNLELDFFGTGIKFAKVNGKRLQPKEIKYSQGRLSLPSYCFKEHTKNTMEIIFQNNYSFLGNGLSSYFLIDDNNKYSLRQQVIYSHSGWIQTPNIMPVFNCLNQCSVHLQVIHPENFQAFATTTKQLQRNCTITQYPKYPFLFDHSLFTNKSVKSSTVLRKSSDTFSNYSSSTYYGRKRANTHFHSTKLPSIHQLFIFCSQMIELIPSCSSNAVQNEVLIRYFCKYAQSHHFTRSVSQIHNFVLQVFRRLSTDKIKQKMVKLDVFIVNDEEIEGHFAPGALILSEESVKSINTDSRCYYLIARGIMGMTRLAQGQNTVRIQQIMQLNLSVFNKFEELRSYIYLMNLQYRKVRQIINDHNLSEFLVKYQGHLLQYYCRELKYVIKQNISDKISFELSNVLSTLKKDSPEQFWENMISNYNFFSQVIIDPLVSFGLKTVGPPTDVKLLDQLKICFNSSKYALSFYSDHVISQNLPKFIESEYFGLQDRLPKLRVLQKFKDFITQRYHNYLPVKSNITQAQIFYNQFKKFNQKKNFHHYSTLKSQIKRVNAFGNNFIIPQKVPIICSLPAWKLFKDIKLYPADSQRYQLLSTLDNIQHL